MLLFLRRFRVRQLPDGLLIALFCVVMISPDSVKAAALTVTTTADSGV